MPESPTSLADFSSRSLSARGRYLVLGPASSALVSWSRSLNIEHVSAAELLRQEIARRSVIGQQAEAAVRRGETSADATVLAVLRRWFWACRPDAGFILSDFPATLLQAQVFDEWLDTRNASLTAVFLGETTPVPDLVTHYRTHGVPLIEVPEPVCL